MSLKHLRKNVENYLFDHYRLKIFLNNGGLFLVSIITAFIFAFGFTCFIRPGSNANPKLTLITGGVSGLSQIVSLIFSMCGVTLPDLIVEAIGYIAFNLPLLILAFCAIGKRFAVFTLVNVATSAVLLYVLPKTGIPDQIGNHPFIVNNFALRIIFGALCTGISSAYAFKYEFSCGGIDILTYYFSLRKSTSIGKYLIGFNASIVCAYTILFSTNHSSQWSSGIVCLFCAIIYIILCGIIIDTINLRNKKIQIQIISNKEDIGEILLQHFPHSATIVKGKGAYSGKEKFVIYTVVSSYEVKKVVYMIRAVDPKAFISVTSLVQVYGNFFIRPIK